MQALVSMDSGYCCGIAGWGAAMQTVSDTDALYNNHVCVAE
jgi:hypothetical protein